MRACETCDELFNLCAPVSTFENLGVFRYVHSKPSVNILSYLLPVPLSPPNIVLQGLYLYSEQNTLVSLLGHWECVGERFIFIL